MWDHTPSPIILCRKTTNYNKKSVEKAEWGVESSFGWVAGPESLI